MNESTREALRELLGSSVIEAFDLRYESTSLKVWRVRTAGHLERIIVKEAVAGTEHADDAWDAIHHDGVCLSAAAPSGVVPPVIALDDEHRVLVMEDLGERPSLADLLLGDDRDAAARGLVELGRSLGRLHAATRDLEAGLGRPLMGNDVTERATTLAAALRTFDVALRDDALADVHAADRELATAPSRALVHGDPCPDNTALLDDGTLALFDFEHASVADGALDAAYLHLPFPTCWCANTIPADVVAEADRAYADAAGVDGDDHLARVASAAVAWCVTSIAWDAARFADTGDRRWGIAECRPRYVTRLRSARAVCERAARHEAFVAATYDIEKAFGARWPAAADGLPRYPAFC